MNMIWGRKAPWGGVKMINSKDKAINSNDNGGNSKDKAANSKDSGTFRNGNNQLKAGEGEK